MPDLLRQLVMGDAYQIIRTCVPLTHILIMEVQYLKMVRSLSSNRLTTVTQSKLVNNLFIFLILVSIGCFTLDVSEARQIMKERAYTVDVSDSYQCGEELELSINAKNRGLFSGDPRNIMAILHNARGLLLYECGQKNNIKTIKIIGVVNGACVYEGRSSQKGGWKVVGSMVNTAVAAKTDDPRGEPLFSNGAISVYPHDTPLSDRNWAKKRELDIVYSYERKSTYRDSKSRQLATILYPIIGKYFSDYFQNTPFHVY